MGYRMAVRSRGRHFARLTVCLLTCAGGLLALKPSVAQEPSEYTLSTAVGTGIAGYNGDNVPALEARTNWAREVAVGPDGSVYFSDEENTRIRRLRPDDIVENVAGTGMESYTGDGGPAKTAGISKARGLTVTADGTILFADSWNHVLRKISPDGIIETICGTGAEGFNGDGQLALQTVINRPNDVAISPEGLVYFSDGRNHRIRRINAEGRVETVAGNGEERYGGDGGPAINASLNSPSGIAFDQEGVLFIADEDNHRVRIVSDGTIITVIGTGEGELGPDDVPPLQARLFSPRDVTVGIDGTVYVADTENQRIAFVRPGGNFRVLAGTGTAGYRGDGGPATSGRLNEPKGIAVDNDGVVYVGDTGNFVLRRISPPMSEVERFLRGDVDGSGDLSINDPVVILNSLFKSDTQLDCNDAADADDGGSINITDPIYVLRFLFLGDSQPSSPFPECGPDPTTEDALDCAVGDACVGGP